jgi:hypothetical protein
MARIREESVAGQTEPQYCSTCKTPNTLTTINISTRNPSVHNNALALFPGPPANKAKFPTDAAAKKPLATLS